MFNYLYFFLILFPGIFRDDVDEAEYLSLAAEPQFDCVGQLFMDTTFTGSCVLIHERFALTAAHVLLESDDRKDTIEINGQRMITYTPVNVRVSDASGYYLRVNGQEKKVKKFIIHPEFLKDLEEGHCDMALVELEQPVSAIKPANINTWDDELSSDVVGVGFGVSGKASKPDSIFPLDKKIAGQNVIDKISGPVNEGRKTILSCDFDAASLKGCNKMGSPLPRPLEYICSGGDSGGGLFKQTGDEWFLVGICSGADTDINQLMKTGYYGQIMDWTRVSAFAKWIDTETK